VNERQSVSAEQIFWSHFNDQSMTSRDGGPRTDLIEAMSAEERARVEDQLLAKLGDPGNSDEWVPLILSFLKSERAIPALRARLATSGDRYSVAVAEALWKLTRAPETVEHIIGILHPRQFIKRLSARLDWMSPERISAVVALGGIDTAESREAVKRALVDHNFFVRANARTSAARLGEQMNDTDQ
jgi:HEAT repeat protein